MDNSNQEYKKFTPDELDEMAVLRLELIDQLIAVCIKNVFLK